MKRLYFLEIDKLLTFIRTIQRHQNPGNLCPREWVFIRASVWDRIGAKYSRAERIWTFAPLSWGQGFSTRWVGITRRVFSKPPMGADVIINYRIGASLPFSAAPSVQMPLKLGSSPLFCKVFRPLVRRPRHVAFYTGARWKEWPELNRIFLPLGLQRGRECAANSALVNTVAYLRRFISSSHWFRSLIIIGADKSDRFFSPSGLSNRGLYVMSGRQMLVWTRWIPLPTKIKRR